MSPRTWWTAVAIAGSALCAMLAIAGAGPLNDPGFAKSLTCAACHGSGGNSRSASMPILAGMDPAYFKKQIDAYAAGRRPSPEMEPYAKMVVQLGVEDVARYFAAQKREPTPDLAPADAIARGRAAAAACAICHGQEGRGDAAKLIPALAGQPAGFLRDQMLLFKRDARNPGDAALQAAKALMLTIPDETLADLAAYYSSIR